VSAIASWLPPTNRKYLQRFLEFANFYRRFIKDFSGTARPFYHLIKKMTDWIWSSAYHIACEQLKTCFSTTLVLWIYNWEKPSVVKTDTSDWSGDGTLLQESKDGEL
jgi:hypothetical protein